MSSPQKTKAGASVPTATTPAMRQYLQQKAQVGEAILFFRMGDFYEMFYEDAKTVSKVLGLALTSRSKGSNPIPLAGIPYHAVDSYLARLVRAGYKVAISEQMEDPKEAKGVVKRAIVRIVTPGTLTEQALLNEQEENFLACCLPVDRDQIGLAWVELSTGRFSVLTAGLDQIIDESVRLRPAELLLPEVDIGSREGIGPIVRQLAKQYQELIGGTVTYRPGWWFDPTQVEEQLHKQFDVASLEGFGFDQIDPGLCAAGGVVQYLGETQLTALEHIKNIQPVQRSLYMQLDQTTIRCLELERTIRSGSRKSSLLGSIDQSITAMGARMVRQWMRFPLKDMDRIVLRQDAVDLLGQQRGLLRRIRSDLREISDIERIVARVGCRRASPLDLVGLGQSLRQLPQLAALLEPLAVEGNLLQETRGELLGLEELTQFLGDALNPNAPSALKDGGVIADGFDAELDRLRSVSKDGQSWLAKFQSDQIRNSGIATLKVGYNQVFGYYIEISNTHRQRVPTDYVRKQTLKNAERYITEELKQYEQEQLTAQERARHLESRLFEQVRSKVAQYIPSLQRSAAAVARLDVLGSLAYLASMRGYCRPEIVTEPVLKIIDGRHPVLDVTLAERFVPNDTQLTPEQQQMMIITGPNMAGKSTYIRQVALLVLLAHTGSFIPAKQAAVGLVDRIFTRVGASDELVRGQSTFMVEMTETANILNNATDRSLVILDEIGRGTSTFDGLALAWAITEYIAKQITCRTLFATHYHELTELEQLLPKVKNYNVTVREWEDQIIFMHKIVDGGTDKSYGIHVGRLAGLPKPLLQRSRKILAELEGSFAREARLPTIAGQQAENLEPALFDQPHEQIARQLKDLNLDKLTPIEALGVLKNLQNQLE